MGAVSTSETDGASVSEASGTGSEDGQVPEPGTTARVSDGSRNDQRTKSASPSRPGTPEASTTSAKNPNDEAVNSTTAGEVPSGAQGTSASMSCSRRVEIASAWRFDATSSIAEVVVRIKVETQSTNATSITEERPRATAVSRIVKPRRREERMPRMVSGGGERATSDGCDGKPIRQPPRMGRTPAEASGGP